MTVLVGGLPFDRVEIRSPDGVEHLGVAQFREMPLNRRVRLLLNHRVAFYLRSEEISPKLALKSLAEQRARELDP